MAYSRRTVTDGVTKMTAELYDNLQDGIDELKALPVSAKVETKAVVLNNVEKNAVVAPYTTATGSETVAGIKGYYCNKYIEEVLGEKDGKPIKTFRLYFHRTQEDTNNEVLGDYDNPINVEYEVGDTISIGDNHMLYSNCGKITKVTSVWIEVDALPITQFTDRADLDEADRLVFVLDKPDVGFSTIGDHAVALGDSNISIGFASFTSGRGNIASGTYAHALGRATKAFGYASFTEGLCTIASNYAHAEGGYTEARGNYSHSEGDHSKALAYGAHAEGQYTKATANTAHSENHYTEANGEASHAEGSYTKANGRTAHAEGDHTEANGGASHTEGYKTKAYAYSSHAEGSSTRTGKLDDSGNYVKDTGNSAHAEGKETIAEGLASHAEGYQTKALGHSSHAQGNNTTASGNSSHAEGIDTVASGIYSHASGYKTVAEGKFSYTGGSENKANGEASHAEGFKNTANGARSFIIGQWNSTTVEAQDAFVHGIGNSAKSPAQRIGGKYAKVEAGSNIIEAVGNGTSGNNRSNAYTLDLEGNAKFAKSVETKTLIAKATTSAENLNDGVTIYDSVPSTKMSVKISTNLAPDGSYSVEGDYGESEPYPLPIPLKFGENYYFKADISSNLTSNTVVAIGLQKTSDEDDITEWFYGEAQVQNNTVEILITPEITRGGANYIRFSIGPSDLRNEKPRVTFYNLHINKGTTYISDTEYSKGKKVYITDGFNNQSTYTIPTKGFVEIECPSSYAKVSTGATDGLITVEYAQDTGYTSRQLRKEFEDYKKELNKPYEDIYQGMAYVEEGYTSFTFKEDLIEGETLIFKVNGNSYEATVIERTPNIVIPTLIKNEVLGVVEKIDKDTLCINDCGVDTHEIEIYRRTPKGTFLYSPNGKKFKLTINNDGSLKTEEVEV